MQNLEFRRKPSSASMLLFHGIQKPMAVRMARKASLNSDSSVNSAISSVSKAVALLPDGLAVMLEMLNILTDSLGEAGLAMWTQPSAST
jgi:hypothetical protein